MEKSKMGVDLYTISIAFVIFIINLISSAKNSFLVAVHVSYSRIKSKSWKKLGVIIKSTEMLEFF